MHGVLMQATTSLLASGLVDIWAAIEPWFFIVLGFSAVIFVHELGHFILAKWAGVRVEKFCIGFGRELLTATTAAASPHRRISGQGPSMRYSGRSVSSVSPKCCSNFPVRITSRT